MTRKQCESCPWKVTTNPETDIPGYSVERHRNLSCTIADGPYLHTNLRPMACHKTSPGQEQMCVGWLHNQLGVGNNISLRLAALKDRTLFDYELDGEQHERFEDTLPMKVTVKMELDPAHILDTGALEWIIVSLIWKIRQQHERPPSLCDAPEDADVIRDPNGNIIGSVELEEDHNDA